MKDSYKKDVERIILRTLSIVKSAFENFDRYDVRIRVDFEDNQCNSYTYHYSKDDYKSILSELIKMSIDKNIFTTIGRIDVYCINGVTVSCWLNCDSENNNLEIGNIEIYYKNFKIRTYKTRRTPFDEFFICVFCNEKSVFGTTLSDNFIGVDIYSISSIYNDISNVIINKVNMYYNEFSKYYEYSLLQDNMRSNNILKNECDKHLNETTITEEEIYDLLRKF